MTAVNRAILILVLGVSLLAAAFVAVALTEATPVGNPVLGEEWQCTRMALLTSCARVGPPQSVVHDPRRDPRRIPRV